MSDFKEAIQKLKQELGIDVPYDSLTNYGSRNPVATKRVDGWIERCNHKVNVVLAEFDRYEKEQDRQVQELVQKFAVDLDNEIKQVERMHDNLAKEKEKQCQGETERAIKNFQAESELVQKLLGEKEQWQKDLEFYKKENEQLLSLNTELHQKNRELEEQTAELFESEQKYQTLARKLEKREADTKQLLMDWLKEEICFECRHSVDNPEVCHDKDCKYSVIVELAQESSKKIELHPKCEDCSTQLTCDQDDTMNYPICFNRKTENFERELSPQETPRGEQK